MAGLVARELALPAGRLKLVAKGQPLSAAMLRQLQDEGAVTPAPMPAVLSVGHTLRPQEVHNREAGSTHPACAPAPPPASPVRRRQHPGDGGAAAAATGAAAAGARGGGRGGGGGRPRAVRCGGGGGLESAVACGWLPREERAARVLVSCRAGAQISPRHMLPAREGRQRVSRCPLPPTTSPRSFRLPAGAPAWQRALARFLQRRLRLPDMALVLLFSLRPRFWLGLVAWMVGAKVGRAGFCAEWAEWGCSTTVLGHLLLSISVRQALLR